MSGCSRIASTATLSPWTTLKTPSGTPGLVQQLGEEDRRRRVLLGRLEDERVAARDRVGEHPHRHHRREVERRDAGDDAERLADLVDVDAGRDLLAEAALEQVRDAARELEVLEAAGDLAERVGRDLAVLGGQAARRCSLRCCSTRFRMLEQDLGALATATSRASAGKAALRRRDGRVDLLGRGEVDLLGQPCRSPGRRPAPSRPDVPATRRPPIQWLTRPGAGRVGDRRVRRPVSWEGPRRRCMRPDTPSIRSDPQARPSEPRPSPDRARTACCGLAPVARARRGSRTPRTSAPAIAATAIDHEREHAADGQRADDGRIAPGRRDRRAGDAPTPRSRCSSRVPSAGTERAERATRPARGPPRSQRADPS